MRKLLFIALIVVVLASCSLTNKLDTYEVTVTSYVAPDLMFDTDEFEGCLNPAFQFGFIGNLMFDKVGLHYNGAVFLPAFELFNEASGEGKFSREIFDFLMGSSLGLGLAIKLPGEDANMAISPMLEMINSIATIGNASQSVMSIGAGIDWGGKGYLTNAPTLYFGFNHTLTVHFFQMQRASIGNYSNLVTKNDIMIRIVPKIYIGFDL